MYWIKKLVHEHCVPDVADALVGVGLICNSENMPGVLMLDKDYNNMSKFLNRLACRLFVMFCRILLRSYLLLIQSVWPSHLMETTGLCVRRTHTKGLCEARCCQYLSEMIYLTTVLHAFVFSSNCAACPIITLYLISSPWSYLLHEVRVKVQFTLEQATKAQRGSRGIVLLFL
jgi:hypothetical protein